MAAGEAADNSAVLLEEHNWNFCKHSVHVFPYAILKRTERDQDVTSKQRYDHTSVIMRGISIVGRSI